MKLEDTVLREMASHKRTHTAWSRSCDIVRVVEFIETESSTGVAWGWERRGNEQLVLDWRGVSVWEDEKRFWNWRMW